MKILQVITSLLTGGAETLVVNLVPRLREMGNEVDVCVFNGVETPLMDRLRRENPGIKIWKLGKGYYNPLYIFKLARIMRGYDIVHTHNSSPQLFVVCAEVLCSVELCSTEHNTSNRKRGWKWYVPFERLMYGRYEHIICISKIAEEKLREYLGGEWLIDGSKKYKKISTINNGVDVDAIHNAKPLDERRTTDGQFVITMVAGFREAKDQDTIVRALTKLPENYVAWFVGEGVRMPKVRQLANDCGVLDRVKFWGRREDVPRILKSSDVIVMSSHWEGLSLSNIEGMSAGKPFIASDVDGLREVTKGYGLLFPEGNDDELAHEIIRLHDDSKYYHEVASKCYDRAKQFDISTTAKGYAQVYKKKLIRLTTADISLDSLLRGQLKYLNQYYDVVGVAADTGVLHTVHEREDIRVIDIPMHREISIKHDLRALWLLFKLFREEKPDILHANTPKGSLLAMVAGMMARIPKRIYTVTGLRYQGAHGLFRILLKTMERITCMCATNVVPEGKGVLHCLQEDHITKKPLKIIWNGNINGKDTDYLSTEATEKELKAKDDDLRNASHADIRHYLRKKLGFNDNDFVFLFVGRVVHDKGINELAEAMRKLTGDYPHVRLLIVGELDGDLDPVKPKNMKYFTESPFVNYVGLQTDVRPYYMTADALVFPSYREGFPNVPMEAGCFNLPSIVTDINGCNEIIKDGLNGKIIVAPLDKDGNRIAFDKGDKDSADWSTPMERALYETMKWFLDHPAEVKRMAGNSRRMIQERYEQEDVWKAIKDFYESLYETKD